MAAASAVVGGIIAVASAIAYAHFTSPRESSSFAGRRPSITSHASDDGAEPPLTPYTPTKAHFERRDSLNRHEMRERLMRRHHREKAKSEDAIHRIVLTGGPCGGKSSCLNQLVKRLQEQRYNVYVAPEMPTLLKQHCECPYPFKPNPTIADTMHALSWESNKMQLQADMEDALYDLARSSGEKTVILCDRGLPDSAAYVSEDAFQTILDDHDWMSDKLMARYSLVVHLESAAIDTSLYTTLASNNAARFESEDEARAQDLATQKAWASHPNVKMIRNCVCGEDFERKKQMTVSCVLEHLGLAASSTTTHRRLFILHRHPPTSLFDLNNLKCDHFTIDSTFLRDIAGGGTDRVVERRGRVGGVWTYTLSHAIELKPSVNGSTNASAPATPEKGPPRPAKFVRQSSQSSLQSNKYIDEVRIGGRMYTGLLAERATQRRPVKRKERVFTHFVPASGRDVVHRLVEIIGEPSHNAPGAAAIDESPVIARRGPLRSQRRSYHQSLTAADGADASADAAAEAAAAAAAAADLNNIELLYVDGLDDGSDYEPPAFLAPFIEHEVHSADDRARYSLKSLSER